VARRETRAARRGFEFFSPSEASNSTPPLSEPALPDLPAGYRVERAENGVLAVAEWAARELDAAGFGLDADGSLQTSEVAGKRALSQTPDGRILVRFFTHGGLLRLATGRRFRDAERPFRELWLSSWLIDRGVDTPPVAAARARRAGPFGYELALATRRIPRAQDVESHLVRARSDSAQRASLRPILAALGAFVARLHALGFLHADLTTKNVLVELRPDGAPRLWLLDLDRSRIVAPLPPERARTNLRRLWRFVERREERDGRALTRTDVARFLRAYEPDRRRRHALWRDIAREHAHTRLWHRLGWIVEFLSSMSGHLRGR